MAQVVLEDAPELLSFLGTLTVPQLMEWADNIGILDAKPALEAAMLAGPGNQPDWC